MIKFEDVEPPEEGGPDPLALLVEIDQNPQAETKDELDMDLQDLQDNPQCFEGLAKDELDMDLQDLKEEPDLGDAHTTS